MKQRIKLIATVFRSGESLPIQKKEFNIDSEYARTANAIMNAPGYIEYIKKHGYHFTEKLARHVSSGMQNVCGTAHEFTAAHVTGIKRNHNETDGDLIYTANMAFADFYPQIIPTTEMCIKYAEAVAQDPDGYDGMEFTRWTSDAIGKSKTINWEEFI